MQGWLVDTGRLDCVNFLLSSFLRWLTARPRVSQQQEVCKQCLIPSCEVSRPKKLMKEDSHLPSALNLTISPSGVLHIAKLNDQLLVLTHLGLRAVQTLPLFSSCLSDHTFLSLPFGSSSPLLSPNITGTQVLRLRLSSVYTMPYYHSWVNIDSASYNSVSGFSPDSDLSQLHTQHLHLEVQWTFQT